MTILEQARVDLVRLRPRDAGEVLTLQRAAYVSEALLHEDLALPPVVQSLEELREELGDAAVTGLGMRADGRLVAAVRVRLSEPGTADVARLAVVPDLQGRGLGTRLLHAAESVVPPGTARIRLFTGERSLDNLRLYERLGYRETHRTAVGGYSLVHLAKALPARDSQPAGVAAGALAPERTRSEEGSTGPDQG